MTIGQTAILDAWLSQYTPIDTLDDELDHVFTTEEIISDLSDMADWDTNEVADYIAQAGFRFTPPTRYTVPTDGYSGTSDQ